jgi:uncharacterized membrane protein
MANASELIKAEHRKVAQLYQRYQSANGQTQQKKSMVQEICHELELHAKLEEELFYPAVKRTLVADETDLVKEAIKEHHEMKRALSQLQMSQFAGPDCDRLFREMMSGVQHHVKEEETKMLPKAQQQLGVAINRLGAQMRQRQQELQNIQASTRQPGTGSRAQHMREAGQETGEASSIEQSIDVKVPVRTAYNQWTQFEEFPHFMEGVQQVRQLTETQLHWKADIGGKEKEWEAKITEQIPDERIAWTNTTGARNAGVVTFHRLAENQTRIMLQLEYDPEGFVENLSDIVGVVSSRVRGDLNRFKEFIESRSRGTGAWRGTVDQPHHS